MTTGGESGNLIAEKRRQRKLENQRLEAAARQRQEELRLYKERELNRQEDERIAAEQLRLDEVHRLKRQREAELERIASIERNEKDRVLAIEEKLKLLGAFCTREISVPSVPQCCAVLSPAALEHAVTDVDETLLLVADVSGHIHVFRLSDARTLFRILMDHEAADAATERRPDPTIRVTSMCTTRSSHLIVCDQQRGAIGVYDLHYLLALYHTASLSSTCIRVPVIQGSHSLVATYAFPNGRIRAVSVDNTASELFVSDELCHCVHVLTITASSLQLASASTLHTTSKPPILWSRTFGAQGHGRGQLLGPAGLDVSHYHVLVCDRGNHRVTAFTKRGAFVTTFGAKGSLAGQFQDPQDVKLANVRKRALSRGLSGGDNGISNEQFEIVVADLGNFRVQILTEAGVLLRVLSLLSGGDQFQFHQAFLAAQYAHLLELYASIHATLPSLAGTNLRGLFPLSERLHPCCSTYQKITETVHAIREDAARFHHPWGVAYVSKDREIVVLDRQNATLFVYSMDGSKAVWTNLPVSTIFSTHDTPPRGLSSVHSSLVANDIMYVSDPLSHRIAVLQYPSLSFLRYIGATTYGDLALCAEGILTGELRSPTYLTTYEDHSSELRLLVADTGNHCVSVFDPESGDCCGRIGLGFGHLDGFLDSPHGLAVVENHWLFVCDHRNHRVQVFDLDTGAFVRSIGSGQGTLPGQFSFPLSVAVCGALPRIEKCFFGGFRDAKYCVGDAGNHRVQVLAMENDSVLWIVDASHTPFELPMLPSAVLFHATSSYVLITDSTNRSVVIFRHDGSFVSAFGSQLESENCFQRPTSVQLVASASNETECVVVMDAVRLAICTFDMRAH